MTDFLIANGKADVEIEIKKSRFIAKAFPIENREDAMKALSEEKEAYPDARHHCWAYLLGSPGVPASAAMSDDGEPSGTAGKPILNVLQHSGVHNVLIVVIRYFGGIKLGAGGLVRAYSGAAQQVMECVPTISYVPVSERIISLDFSQEQPLRHWLTQHDGEISAIDYTEKVNCTILLPDEHMSSLMDAVVAQGWEIHDI